MAIASPRDWTSARKRELASATTLAFLWTTFQHSKGLTNQRRYARQSNETPEHQGSDMVELPNLRGNLNIEQPNAPCSRKALADLPRWGSMRNGELFEIAGPAFTEIHLLRQTPVADDATRLSGSSMRRTELSGAAKMQLTPRVKRWSNLDTHANTIRHHGHGSGAGDGSILG